MTDRLKTILEKTVDWLDRKNDKLDYYISLVQDPVWLSGTFTAGQTGVTRSDSSFYMIGNYLHFYVVLNLTSAAQSTFGTGNVTNKEICHFTFSNVYYGDNANDTTKDYSSLTNAERKNKIGFVTGVGVPINADSNSPVMAAYIINDHTNTSGLNLRLTLMTSAIKASSSSWTFRGVIPLRRLPWDSTKR